MTRKSRWEYLKTIYERYQKAAGKLKGKMLDELCANTGYNRKYAIRVLNGAARQKAHRRRRIHPHKLTYSGQMMSILVEVWKAAGYPWSVKLKALLPLWLPWIVKRFKLTIELQRQLLSISARQIDRRLKDKKSELKRRMYGRTKPGSLLKHHIPIKTDCWDVTIPGYTEIDLVSHSGNSASGEFAHSLNVTDIHTTWTESRAVMGRSQIAVQQALEQIRAALPFPLVGIDSDNGSEFINAHLKTWCDSNKIQFTRGRPYKKDDNAHVEQKNWTHVRKILGWDRYDSLDAVKAINQLNEKELRLLLNLYIPSVKLIKKVRVGSKLKRVYDSAQTPLQRVIASAGADSSKVAALKKVMRTLDPFQLAQSIERKLHHIYDLANVGWGTQVNNDSKSVFHQQGQVEPEKWKNRHVVTHPIRRSLFIGDAAKEKVVEKSVRGKEIKKAPKKERKTA